jgi:hypothetical protein
VDWAESAANFVTGEAQKYLLDSGFELKTFATNQLLRKELTIGHEMIIATHPVIN